MKCGYCGRVLREGSKFCTGCGRRIDNFQAEDKQNTGDSYLGAVITLIMLVIILSAGGVFMILRGLSGSIVSNTNIVSNSSVDKRESSEVSSQISSQDEFNGDSAIFGRWICNDKSAAGYTDSDYGIEVSLMFTLSEQGDFSVNYIMTDTGITAIKVMFVGSYSTENGRLSLKPDLSDYDGNYFKVNGEQQSVNYSIKDNTLTIVTPSGNKIVFTKDD